MSLKKFNLLSKDSQYAQQVDFLRYVQISDEELFDMKSTIINLLVS